MPTIYTTAGMPGYRPMEFKAFKNGLIMARVVGSGKLFSWGRWGTLAPGDTMTEFAKRKGLMKLKALSK